MGSTATTSPFDSFVKDLQTAADEVCPTRPEDQYSRVIFFAFIFEGVELSHVTNARQMCQVMSREYGFETNLFELPKGNCMVELWKELVRVMKMVSEQNSNNLLIVYYIGHSYVETEPWRVVFTRKKRVEQGDTGLHWTEYQDRLLKTFPVDVWFIMETHFPLQAMRSPLGRLGAVEFLSSASMSPALAATLRRLKNEAPAVDQLCQEMMKMMISKDYEVPSYQKVDSGEQSIQLFKMKEFKEPTESIRLPELKLHISINSDTRGPDSSPWITWIKTQVPAMIEKMIITAATTTHDFVITVKTALLPDRPSWIAWIDLIPENVKKLRLDVGERSERELETFVAQLNANGAIVEMLEQMYYKEVTVLPIIWKKPERRYLSTSELKEQEEQLSDIKQELLAIGEVFQDRFNYNVLKIFEISDESSQWANTELVSNISGLVVKYGRKRDSLVIIVYGGHGINTRTPTNAWGKKFENENIWAASTSPCSAWVNWSSIQGYLEDAECDTLMIIDCCYSGNAVTRSVPQTTNEILAAAVPDAPSYFGTHAYSRAIARKLRDMQIPFTAQQLHEALHAESRQKPMSKHEHAPLATPDHGFTGNSRKRSISFRDLPPINQLSVSRRRLSHLKALTPPLQDQKPRIFVEVELNPLGNIVATAQEWEEWFTKRNPPTSMHGVRFHTPQDLLPRLIARKKTLLRAAQNAPDKTV